MVAKEYQLPMLLVLSHIQSETQKRTIVVFPSVDGDMTHHIVDGTCSNA